MLNIRNILILVFILLILCLLLFTQSIISLYREYDYNIRFNLNQGVTLCHIHSCFNSITMHTDGICIDELDGSTSCHRTHSYRCYDTVTLITLGYPYIETQIDSLPRTIDPESREEKCWYNTYTGELSLSYIQNKKLSLSLIVLPLFWSLIFIILYTLILFISFFIWYNIWYNKLYNKNIKKKKKPKEVNIL